MLDQWMHQLSQDLSIEPSFEVGASGSYEFPVDEGNFVTIQSAPTGFAMHYLFDESPWSDEEGFYLHALHANLYGRGTKGAILGLDLEGKKLTLTRLVDNNPSYQEFKDCLEDFLNTLDLWREEMKLGQGR